MTSKERVVAALTGQPYDRIPVFMLLSDQAARTIGVTVCEYQKSALLLAHGQLTAWRSYGMDMINTGPGLTGIAEAAGSRLAFPDDTAYVVETAIKDISDLELLKIPDPNGDDRLPLFLEATDIRISMDGKGRAIDNIFVERIWRSLKYEEVYLKDYETVQEAKDEIKIYVDYYNNERPHHSLDMKTPAEVYFKGILELADLSKNMGIQTEMN